MSLGSGESERKVEIHEKLTASKRVWHFKKFPKLTIDDIEFELTPESKKLFERGKPDQGYLAVGEIMPDGKIVPHLRPAFAINESDDPAVKGIGDRPELIHRPIKPKNPTKKEQSDKDFMEKYDARMKEWQIKQEEYQEYLRKDKEWMAKWEAWVGKPENFVDKNGVPYASNEFVVTGDAKVKGNTGIGHKRMIKMIGLYEKGGIQSKLIGFGIWKGDFFILNIFAERSLSQNGYSVVWHDKFFKQYVFNGMEMYGIANRDILEGSIEKMKLPAFVICADPARKYIIDQNMKITDCGAEIDERIIKRIKRHENNLTARKKNQLISYEKFSNLKAMVELSDETLKKSGLTPFVILSKQQQLIKQKMLCDRARSLPWALSEKMLGFLLKNLPDTPFGEEERPLLHDVGIDARSLIMTNPIFDAVKEGDLEEVQKWIEVGGSPNEIGCPRDAYDDPSKFSKRNALSLIEVALKNNQIKIFQYLFRHPKFDREKFYKEMLFQASKNGVVEIVDFLLKEPFTTKKQDRLLQKCLQGAAKHGHVNVVKILLQHKADPTATDSNGNTPLHLAANYSHSKVMEELLIGLRGSDLINSKNDDGYTPLHLAVMGGHIQPMISLSALPGVNFAARDNQGNTALHLAAKGGDIDYQDIVKFLLTKILDVNTANKNGNSPLHLALMNNETRVAELLLANGADVNANGGDNDTPLHLAVWSREESIVEKLITMGADVNAVNISKNTPLHLAIIKRERNIVKLLLVNEADVNAINSLKDTPLHVAAVNGDFDIFGMLLAMKGDVAAVNDDNQTALHLAAKYGHKQIVLAILTQSVSVDTSDINGRTALHLAALKGNTDIVELLINEKADINQADIDGNTPLHLAAKFGNKNVMELLLSENADITAQNNLKKTALHLAVMGEEIDIVKLLVQKFPHLMTIKDKEGKTPLDMASNKEIANILQAKLSQGILRFSTREKPGEKIKDRSEEPEKDEEDKPKP